MSILLEVQGLTVGIPSRFGEFTAVEDVDLRVAAGEIHGVVGESGAGKSTIGSAIIGLLEYPAYVRAGSIRLQGDELTTLDESEYHSLRGNRISMIFQDPQTSLNPLLTIADQLIETIQQHRDLNDEQARELAIDLLSETGIENAKERLNDYPHQFSGGMRQRVVISLALCTDPELIIADEPTTALDVSVQKQILKLIRDLAKRRQVGFILITHDIGVIAEVTDNVTVLRYGQVVETGPTAQVLGTPAEEYTQALMAAVPRLDKRLDRFHNIVTDDKRIDGEAQWHVNGASADYASQWLLHNREESNSIASTEHHSKDTPMLSVNHLDVTFGKATGWFKRRPGFIKKFNLEDFLIR